MFTFIKEYFVDFYRLFYPKLCGGCDVPLLKGEHHLCLHCRIALPFTNFENIKDNPVERVFYGRVDIENATTLFYFTKGEKVQHILHNIKYNNNKELALYIGRVFGERLINTKYYNNITTIIPTPLHPQKEHLRGYNQSALFAEGMNEILQKKLSLQNLQRTLNTESQTNKNRTERWENVENAFNVVHPQELQQQHILLIDDVLTTGATLEACAQTLKKAANCKVSIATIAYALQ